MRGNQSLERGLSRLNALGTAIAILFVVVATAPGAQGAETHVFDPVLSLTGGCTTSSLDLVEDPGCPGSPLPPSGSFSGPSSVATDFYGNIYVANLGQMSDGSQGRIDIFDPAGYFITEIPDPAGPQSLAIDSIGTLYVVNKAGEQKLVRYSPSQYEAAARKIAYANPPVVLMEKDPSPWIGLSVNVTNDHLFGNFGTRIVEFESAAEGNDVAEDPIAELNSPAGVALAVDSAHGRIYANAGQSAPIIKVFELAPPHALLATIEGSSVPGGKFLGRLSVAVDEGSGHIFLYDSDASKVYELTASGAYVSTIEHGFQYVDGAEIGVDNGSFSPNGKLNEDGRYLFVPSHKTGIGHSFAFGPAPKECAPTVQSTTHTNVTETEAELRATINPCNLETSYVFEYTSQERFEQEGFSGASVAGGGQIPASSIDSTVSVPLSELLSGVEYHFRVTAVNAAATAEGEGRFSTYPANPILACQNDAVRTGASAFLPDCRAYELVTPGDTNGRAPQGVGRLGTYFTTREASPSGGAVSFQIEGGSIPGSNATGSFAGDPYLANRGPTGWSSSYIGPSGAEAPALLPGSPSPDQRYSFWSTANGEGGAAVNGEAANYVRYPDGHSELVGRGSIDIDPLAVGRLISEGGGHIVFVTGSISGTTARQLEPAAPPDGTRAIYDRTADGVTHIVSLLPGNLTPKAGEDAVYQGASLDGRGVAFSIANVLYLRFQNSETFKIGEGVTFAGVTEGGNRVFYLEGGKLFRFDALAKAVTAFNPTGSVVPVNVAPDGTAAYFVSTSVLTGAPSPLGAKAKLGEQNLYFSEEGMISFVGAVSERDVVGDISGNDAVEGLGLWTTAVGPSPYGAPGRLAEDPSRATPDGRVLLFESRAMLTDYNPDGHAQVYRFDSLEGTLQCISCNATGASASGEASLQSISQQPGDSPPFSSFAVVSNLRSDGRRAFFQSTEALATGDTDGLQDVYEWEDEGVGSCDRAGGCVYLISSGHSRRNDFLYAVSDSGDDVFFRTSDLLLASDQEETPSVYDVRVGGGFAESINGACEGEGCHPEAPSSPTLATPQTSPGRSGSSLRRCPKGKRKVRHHRKIRCVNKKRHRRHHHKVAAGQKGSRT